MEPNYSNKSAIIDSYKHHINNNVITDNNLNLYSSSTKQGLLKLLDFL